MGFGNNYFGDGTAHATHRFESEAGPDRALSIKASGGQLASPFTRGTRLNIVDATRKQLFEDCTYTRVLSQQTPQKVSNRNRKLRIADHEALSLASLIMKAS